MSARPRALNRRAGTPSYVRPPCPGEPPETSACLVGPSPAVGRPAFGERTGSARRPSAGRDFATVLCNHGPSGTRGEGVGEPPETGACLAGPSMEVGRPASGEGTGSAQRPSAGHGLAKGVSSPGPRGTRGKRVGVSLEFPGGGRRPVAVGRSLSERRAEIGNPHGGQSWTTPGCTHVRLCATRWAPERSQDPGPGSSEEALCAGAGRTGASRPQAPRARRPGRTATEAAPR